MRGLFLPSPPPVRASEATADQIIATGAMLGMFPGTDPIDGDTGYRPAGSAGRQTRATPFWTLEKARVYSVAGYRYNPMARAIIDTYTSFAVGDSGVKFECSDPKVRAVVDEFWNDDRNQVGEIQDLWLRSMMILGEDLTEMLVGQTSGAVYFSPIDPGHIFDVECDRGNPLWPSKIRLNANVTDDEENKPYTVVRKDLETGLRDGQVMFWAPWRTLMTDRRGDPFLMPILDDLESYDTVISNLVDRTAMMRYLVFDVEVDGDETDIKKFINDRKGTHIPPPGSMEVHTSKVKIKPVTAETGALEDSVAAQTVLTKLAAGAGLAKTWLAEPEGANRATSLTMAEPVRRRVAGVQKTWLSCQTRLVRFVVDRAVAAKRLPATVTITDAKTGATYDIPAAQSVTVTGPEVAAADAQVTAAMLMNLSTGLKQMVDAGVMTKEAARVASKKAWEQFTGIPYRPELDTPDTNPDDVATHVDDNPPDPRKLRVVQG